MKDNVMSKLVLPLICACSAILLSIVNLITAPRIAEYENKVALSALKEVCNGYDFDQRIEVTDNQYVTYYYELKDSNNIVGYILGLKTSGYGGEISLVSSFDLYGKIINVKMISNNETPGVGKKSENDGYMDMFIGTGTSVAVPVKKDMLSLDNQSLVCGATLTFAGISKALSSASDFVKSI